MKLTRIVSATLVALSALALASCSVPGITVPTEDQARESITAGLADAGYLVTHLEVDTNGIGHDVYINIDGRTPYSADDLAAMVVAALDAGAGEYVRMYLNFPLEPGPSSLDGEYQDVCAEFAKLGVGGSCSPRGFDLGEYEAEQLRER